MLTPMDDTLWHTLPTTFDHVGTSDPRFFDRYWFAASDPQGGGTLQLTLGVYNNMNVVDAGFVAIREGRQYNVRASRSLRPRFESVCGPLRVEMLEPLRRARLVVEDDGGRGIAADLEWQSVLPAQEEAPRFTRVRGRVVEESRRFDQIGECSGWLELEGHRIEVERWWATRDHSWGVREQMGIPEPVTGPATPPTAGALFAFLFFSTDSIGGHVQLAQFAGRPDYFTAEIARRERARDSTGSFAGQPGDREEAPGEMVELVEARLAAEFYDDRRPRRFRSARFEGRLADGETVVIGTEALCPAVDMQGIGYSGGYADGRGLGVWRGEEHVESDVWDVSHPTDVRRSEGQVVRPIHRIQPVRVEVRGAGLEGFGTGSLTLIAEGSLPQLGLD